MQSVAGFGDYFGFAGTLRRVPGTAFRNSVAGQTSMCRARRHSDGDFGHGKRHNLPVKRFA
jgi:hypothetical protein